MEMKVLAVIIGRKGSKGFPNKNIRPCAGKPAIAWSIEAALESKITTDIVLSTDSDEIAEIGLGYPLVRVLRRPPELGADDVPGYAVIQHAVQAEIAEGRTPYIVVMLQGDLPLRTGTHIDHAIGLLLSNSDASSVVAFKELSNWPGSLIYKTNVGFTEKAMPNIAPTFLRQENRTICGPCGLIFAARLKDFLSNPTFYGDKILPLFIPAHEAIEIENQNDLELAEWYLRKRGPETRFDDMHKGARAWVIGTGPSLREITAEQWEKIDQELTIGVNNIAAFHDVRYLVTADTYAARSLAGFAASKAEIKFVIDSPEFKPDYEVVRFKKSIYQPTYKFANGLMVAGSSSHAALNLALVMGCDPIILLGIDYNAHEHVIPQQGDNPGEIYGTHYYQRTLEPGRKNFDYFIEHARSLGRTIINANPKSFLSAFPKKPLVEILSNGRLCQ